MAYEAWMLNYGSEPSLPTSISLSPKQFFWVSSHICHKGRRKKMVFLKYFLNRPPPLGIFRNPNVTFGQKSRVFKAKDSGTKISHTV